MTKCKRPLLHLKTQTLKSQSAKWLESLRKIKCWTKLWWLLSSKTRRRFIPILMSLWIPSRGKEKRMFHAVWKTSVTPATLTRYCRFTTICQSLSMPSLNSRTMESLSPLWPLQWQLPKTATLKTKPQQLTPRRPNFYKDLSLRGSWSSKCRFSLVKWLAAIRSMLTLLECSDPWQTTSANLLRSAPNKTSVNSAQSSSQGSKRVWATRDFTKRRFSKKRKRKNWPSKRSKVTKSWKVLNKKSPRKATSPPVSCLTRRSPLRSKEMSSWLTRAVSTRFLSSQGKRVSSKTTMSSLSTSRVGSERSWSTRELMALKKSQTKWSTHSPPLWSEWSDTKRSMKPGRMSTRAPSTNSKKRVPQQPSKPNNLTG